MCLDIELLDIEVDHEMYPYGNKNNLALGQHWLRLPA